MPNATRDYPAPVLPPQGRRITDPLTGTELLFVAAGPDRDLALYLHQRAWLADESLVLFQRGGPEGGLMGYLPATGEVARLTTARGDLSGAVAAREGNRVFAVRGREIIELAISLGSAVAQRGSQVSLTERVIATLPERASMATLLQENADGTLLGFGVRWEDQGRRGILVVDVQTGEWREVGRIDFASAHVLFSRTTPHLMSFNGRPERLWLVDAREQHPWCLYREAPGEYVTHENWWVDDQVLFLGGRTDQEGHVKVINARTGVVRMIGQGVWVPEPHAEAEHYLNHWYWWETGGSEDGRWVVADNWFGDVVVFDAQTTRPHWLTLGHRAYGTEGATQPTAAWDRCSRRVAFTSQMLGGVHFCIATLPQEWDDRLPYYGPLPDRPAM